MSEFDFKTDDDIFKQDFGKESSSEVSDFLQERGISQRAEEIMAEEDDPDKEIVIENPANLMAEDDESKVEVDQEFKQVEADINKNGWSGFLKDRLKDYHGLVTEIGEEIPALKPQATAGKIAIGAVLDNVQDVGNFAIDASNAFDSWMQDSGYTEQDLVKDDLTLDFAKKSWPQSGDTVEDITRGIAGYLVPFMGAMKVMKGGSMLAKGVKATGVNAGLTFIKQDPEGKNLSNMIQDNPTLSNVVNSYLAIDEDDSAFEARGKSALESVLIDVMFLGTGKAAVSGSKAIAPLAGEGKEKLVKAFSDHLTAMKKSQVNSGNASKIRKNIKKFNESIEDSNYLKEVEMAHVAGINADNVFSLNLVSLSEQKDMLKGLSDVMDEVPEMATRIRTTNDEMLISGVENIRKEGAQAILHRVSSGARTEADVASVGILYEMSLSELGRLAKAGLQTGADADKAAFLRSLEMSQMLSSMSGKVASDAGAVLKMTQFNLHKTDQATKAKFMAQLLETADKEALKNTMQIFSEAAGRSAADLVEVGNKVVARSTTGKLWDAAMEVRVNGLLSSGRTQALSVGSALIRGPVEIAKRQVAVGLTRNAPVGEKVFQGEVNIMAEEFLDEGTTQFLSATAGMLDFVRLGNTALKTQRMQSAQMATKEVRDSVAKVNRLKGEIEKVSLSSRSDELKTAAIKKLSKRLRAEQSKMPGIANFFESQGFKQTNLTSKNWGYDPNSVHGAAMDNFGKIIRGPSWFLSQGDHATGMMHYRMQVHSRAFREAKALQAADPSFDLDAFVKAATDAPYDKMKPQHKKIIQSIREKSIAESNDARFLGKTEGVFQDVNEIFYKVAPLRLMMPFHRVDMNILAQSMEHSPLAPFMGKYRAAIEAGGATAAEAQSKVLFGSSIGMAGVGLAWGGILSGEGPNNREALKMKKASGWQPNSIKIGDTWYNYEKLGEPFNRILKVSATMSEIGGYAFGEHSNANYQKDYMKLGQLFGAAIAESATPGFLTEGFGDIIKSLENPESRTFERTMSNIIQGQVPYSSLLRDIRKEGLPFGIVEADPLKRVTGGDPESPLRGLERMANDLRNMIPGMSKDLPPQRNIFGDTQSYPEGFGPDMISPVYQTTQKDDPVINELIRLGVTGPLAHPTPRPGEEHLSMRMPSNIIGVGAGGTSYNIQLDAKQYDRLVMLTAGIGLEDADMTLKEALAEQINNGYPELGSMADSDQARRVSLMSIYNAYKAAAKAQLQLEDMSIQDKMEFNMLKIEEAVGE